MIQILNFYVIYMQILGLWFKNKTYFNAYTSDQSQVHASKFFLFFFRQQGGRVYKKYKTYYDSNTQFKWDVNAFK